MTFFKNFFIAIGVLAVAADLSVLICWVIDKIRRENNDD